MLNTRMVSFFWLVVGLLIAAPFLQAQTSQSVSLAWNASTTPGTMNYRVRYGTTSGNYSTSLNAGNKTTATVTGLKAGTRYYFAVTATDSSGNESLPSNEVSFQTSSATPPTITLTSPANNSTFTAPTSISLAASVTANGNTITKVQFYNGSTLLGEDSSSPYSFTWNSVAAGTYNVRARVVYGSGQTVDSTSATVTVNASTALPAPWKTVDIGSVSAKGSATAASGVYTVRGAGKINSTKDSFRFVYQTLSGDGEIRARLSSVQTSNSGGFFGVMIRESLNANSRHAAIGVPQTLRYQSKQRSSTGGSTSTTTTSTTSTPPNAWVRLVRSGNTITSYRSSNGSTWTQVDSRKISMASNIYIGLVVASGSTSTANTAQFANVQVTP